MVTTELSERLRQLRRANRLQEAAAVVEELRASRKSAELDTLAWLHKPFWWEALSGRRVTLRRRGPDDVEIVRRCWSDAEFMSRFNRTAARLPSTDAELRALLHREYWSLVTEIRAIHWTILTKSQPVGFISIADISLAHRRAEFLIGVIPGTNPWIAPEASHVVFNFLAHQALIERLTAYFYRDNERALKVALKLGFESEGVLRAYIRNDDGTRSDLAVAGLVLNAAFFEKTQSIRARLLG